MKSTVIFDEYNEIDLKPSDLIKKYMSLTAEDVKAFFLDSGRLTQYPCPGCGACDKTAAFERFGLKYVECPRCHTLYVSSRPAQEDIDRYYILSSARKFWKEELSKVTDQKRKAKIIKPRFDWIAESAQEYMPQAAGHYVDINTVVYAYIEDIAGLFKRRTLLNPLFDAEKASLGPDTRVINSVPQAAGLKGDVDVVSLFEAADRASDTEELFKKVYDMLRPSGLCFITTILSSGFDIQALWENAQNIYPPDRLNILSVKGWEALFERRGFECVEFSTPGVLDLEIVEKAALKGCCRPSRFINYLLSAAGEEVKKDFQEFLQASRLSSYGRILIRKKGE